MKRSPYVTTTYVNLDAICDNKLYLRDGALAAPTRPGTNPS